MKNDEVIAAVSKAKNEINDHIDEFIETLA